jgi:flagellar biosynthetic protein FliR
MNVFVVLVPVKLAAGVVLFALTVPVLGAPMGRVYAAIFQFWEQVLT